MRKDFLLIILFLFTSLLTVNAQDQSKLDSLNNLLQSANQEDSIDYLLQIGLQHFDAENYSTSLEYFFSCLKLTERTNHKSGSPDAENSIGRVYYNLDNFKMALEYYNRALDSYQKLDDEESIGGVLNNLALVYYEIDSIDKAIEFYNLALEIKKKYNDTLNIGAISHNLGLVYNSQGKLDLAIENLETSREIFQTLGFHSYVVNATNNIGRVYFKRKEYNKALRYFQQALDKAQETGSPFLIMDNYKYQADCYSAMKNYQEALWYSNEYYSMKDSLLNIEKNKEIAEIQAKYENEIEEQENMLLKQENEANAATIKLQYIGGIGIFIITILAVTLAAIYYRSNQVKKKANDLLKTQKVEIESKNHDLSLLNDEITKQNQEIKEQKKELEDLNAIKDKLFSIISHEFKSPLNSLKGTLALLKMGALSPKEITEISIELSDKISTTSIFLDNLLNWAKSQMHGIQVRPEDVPIQDITNENVALLRSMAEKKRIKIENKVNASARAFVDPDMLNLILKNLLSNAIKFSLPGGAIEIKNETDEEHNIISIKDSGIGMTEENINMLFQLQTYTSRGTANERGTGLGLYITKNFVESNGGKIWVESDQGKGSTFKFTIPLSETKA